MKKVGGVRGSKKKKKLVIKSLKKKNENVMKIKS